MVEREIVVQATQLGCKVGHCYLLRDINWTIERGEHWVVFGMNGSGKTTLLSILAGFNSYTHGEVTVFGQQYTRENILALRKRIGWVSSSFYDKCYGSESVLDIVLSGLSGTLGIGGRIHDADILKAKMLLRELHMGPKMTASFDILSKGERQNVLIARALITEPEILVLDEPGTGLDVYAREYMLSTVRELAERTQITMIYVTHYIEEILPVFEHCLLLKNGRITAQGDTEKLFTEQALSEFLDYPVKLVQQQGRRYLTMEVASYIYQQLGYSKRKGEENGNGRS